MNKISPIALEIGIVKSSMLEMQANNGAINQSSGLWPYEKSVASVGADNIREQYAMYVERLLEVTDKSGAETIVSVGMESLFNDLIARKNKRYGLVLIPNSNEVDAARIKRNYDDRTVVVNPYVGQNYLGNTTVAVPVFRLADGSLYMYAYSKFFINDNVKNYCYKTMGFEMLPVLKDLDYRFPPTSRELMSLSSIDESFFSEVLTFKQ